MNVNKQELLLFGFNSKHNRDIPIPITKICLSYYLCTDEWDSSRMHQGIELKSDNATILKIKKKWSCNAYLTKAVSTGYHEWKFKVVALSDDEKLNRISCRIAIGLFDLKTDCNIDPPLSHHFVDYYGQNREYIYCFNTSPIYDEWSASINVNDIIEMNLDFDKSQLKWKINGKLLETIKGIKSSKFKVGVNLFAPGDSLQLL